MALLQERQLEEGGGSSSDELELYVEAPTRNFSFLSHYARVGLVVGLVIAATACFHSFSSRSNPLQANVGATIQKNAVTNDAVANANPWMHTGKFTPVPVAAPVAPAATSAAAPFTVAVAGKPAAPASPPINLNPELTPKENLHDGNLCADDEEKFEDLCYKKCSILTGGTHPLRTTAFSCCQSDSLDKCDLTNQKVNMKPCAGFDVSGDINGQAGACPHSKGTCLQDEELYLGTCYKKCAILTTGLYTHRAGPFTCCKAAGVTNCLPLTSATKSSIKFDIGGGTSKDERLPHKPESVLTEQ
eukprot:TRINITY_DN11742_c0_g1_i1.p1 TRINITY_DN11742_c0_g1~~TRINITY_DN11742_c0_g1_i1.p1  ORF type:complete len:330 (-),score=52.83 TRINITY_DN11742_c0_g1_i1:108-1013(-)